MRAVTRAGLGERLLDQAHPRLRRAEPLETGLQPLERLLSRLELFIRALAGAGDSLQLDLDRALQTFQGVLERESAHDGEHDTGKGGDDRDAERDPEDEHVVDASNLLGGRLAAWRRFGTKSARTRVFCDSPGGYRFTTPRVGGQGRGAERGAPHTPG